MAEKFIKHTGLVVPLDAANVDTDAIIPKQFLQKVTRTGFGAHLFNDWRFLDEKGQQPNPEFVLNFPEYKGASILLARENFGCGSSREHAAINPMYLGVKAVIAKSIARIHKGNLVNHGVIPMLFEDPADYDRLDQNDELEFTDLLDQIPTRSILIKDKTKDFTFRARLDLTDNEIAVVLSGGQLSFLKKQLAAEREK